MTSITNDMINNTTDDYNLFILLKKNMIKGEIRLSNLSSNNRSLLHKICYNYGLEHFSTGNYKNRTIIIKNSQHTYFTNSDPLHIQKSDISQSDYTREYNYILTNPPNKFLYEDESEEEKKEYEEENDKDENEEEENDEEENDTNTYSSDESECSESSNSYQILNYANISNQLNTLRIFSYINLVINVIIICNI